MQVNTYLLILLLGYCLATSETTKPTIQGKGSKTTKTTSETTKPTIQGKGSKTTKTTSETTRPTIQGKGSKTTKTTSETTKPTIQGKGSKTTKTTIKPSEQCASNKMITNPIKNKRPKPTNKMNTNETAIEPPCESDKMITTRTTKKTHKASDSGKPKSNEMNRTKIVKLIGLKIEEKLNTSSKILNLVRRFKELRPYDTIGLLYPRESETREVRSLDGIWQMLKGEPLAPFRGILEKWYRQSLKQTKLKLISMPVPASYNDITTDKELRDHVGTVWYERNFFVPTTWQKDRHIWLRFGSVNYVGLVFVNGEQVAFHEFGQLPFQADVTRYLKFGEENRLTVMCDNRLYKSTIPPGQVITEEIPVSGKVLTQKSRLDFFNYAGIQRSVHLYTTPLNHIYDIQISTSLNDNATKGRIEFCALIVDKENEPVSKSLVDVKLLDRDDNNVNITKSPNANCSENFVGMVLIVDDVNPWWPYLMHPEPGYLYKLKVELYNKEKKLLDAYRLPVGIRQIDWNSTSLLINSKPVYFRGFSKHEESDIRGKGLDYPLMTREFNLLKWIGANAYRTSHYPHSEESMQFADEQGIMIIDECPAADMYSFNSDKVLGNHLHTLKQLTHRDRNHPSVIAWSISNEGTSNNKGGSDYYRDLIGYIRTIDPNRPITAATNCNTDQPRECQLAQYLDIIGLNRDAGKSSQIVEKWHKVFKKPVLTLEYGVDSFEGLYMLPWSIGSEEYHGEIFIQHFKAFDQLRQKGWFIGEFVESFADFKKDRAFNKKGVFTSNRQPKMVAHLLRQRYFALGKELDNSTIPNDLYPYVTAMFSKHDASEL